MNNTRTIIVSPSGNFYGSEQVLFDFLTETRNTYSVFVPKKGRFINKLLTEKKHKVISFQNVQLLYLKIFLLVLTGRAKVVYCNEGGHIKYIKALAGLFKKARFICHIRIVEDTNPARIQNLPANITLVSISSYITSLLRTSESKSILTIHDPYIAQSNSEHIWKPLDDKFVIGIIGRVTRTKGLNEIISFCDFLEEMKSETVSIYFFGDVDKQDEKLSNFIERSKLYHYLEVAFKGFVEAKDQIYSSLDMVVHFSKVEPLGRIFFEALDYGRPFIGFNKGGIGEIARILEIDDCMIVDDDHWRESLYSKITQINTNISRYDQAKRNLYRFSAAKYCKALEDVIV